MMHSRRSAYREQSATQRPAAWTEAAVLPMPLQQPGVRWVSAFARAAYQTVSPTAVRDFFRELDANDPLLSRLGWALLLAVPTFAVMAFFASSAPAVAAGLNPWIKPIKFSLSFSTFASTMSLLLLALRIPNWQLKLARRTMAVSIVLEILSLACQAWRSSYAPGAHTLADIVFAQMTNIMVMVNTAIVCWMFVLFCANRVHVKLVDAPMVSAVRQSLVIFLAGNAIGGYMLARGSHTVDATDGGPGLPFLNWSTIGGDLRIAHFIAIHAIQIVPLFAYILSQMAPIPTVKQRRFAIGVVALVVAIAVGGTFVQAALGHPLLAIH